MTVIGPQFELLTPRWRGPSSRVLACVAFFALILGWLPFVLVDGIWQLSGRSYPDGLVRFLLGWLLVAIPCTVAAAVLVIWVLIRLLLTKLGEPPPT